jgi:uncharacterized protein YutE (UPF0331/DUF86 family)
MTKGQEKIFALLKENLALLEKAIGHLSYSYEKCREIDLHSDLSEEQLETLEALAARFARAADIFTQKVIYSLLEWLQEDLQTFVDKMNFCEKIGIITAADDLIEIRALRNAIAHEYQQQNLIELYQKVLNSGPRLNSSISLTGSYIAEKLPKSNDE